MLKNKVYNPVSKIFHFYERNDNVASIGIGFSSFIFVAGVVGSTVHSLSFFICFCIVICFKQVV